MSKVILLNGASSSGKTTLGRALQQALDEPYFYFSSDQLVEAAVLPAVDREARDGRWAWRVIRPRFFDGFHRCIAGLADAGNSLIVEHVLERRAWLEDCLRLLEAHDVCFVGVHCALDELERRERERGDRFIGEGCSHINDGVHTWGPYDIEIDTSDGNTQGHVELLKSAMSRKRSLSAFERMRSSLARETPS